MRVDERKLPTLQVPPPPGEGSWCKWCQAESKRTLKTFEHDRIPIAPSIVELFEPVYEVLSLNDLLERCLGAYIQNSNESLNSGIWAFAPKHLHSRRQVVNIATHLAVSIFNERIFIDPTSHGGNGNSLGAGGCSVCYST